MKARSITIIVLLFGASLLSTSCKKDDPAPATLSAKIQGNWFIATSEGTEWQEGLGVITPRAPEPSLVGSKVMIEDNMFTVKEISGTVLFGPVAFTLDETEIIIPGLGTFDIEDLVDNTSMNWEQNEPKSPSDYEPNTDCGCNLFFQKFWSLTRAAVTPPAGLSLATLEGDWAVSSGEGTEWEEGVGIITPRAPDASLVGLKFRFEDNVITVYDISGTVIFGPVTFTLNATTGLINVGPGSTGLGVYTIKNFVAETTMEWDQRVPIAADYEAQAGCGCNLAFQKFLKFARL